MPGISGLRMCKLLKKRANISNNAMKEIESSLSGIPEQLFKRFMTNVKRGKKTFIYSNGHKKCFDFLNISTRQKLMNMY